MSLSPTSIHFNKLYDKEGIMDDNTAWVPRCLQDPEVDDQKTWMKGWVESEEDLQTVLEAHRRASLSTFVTWSDDSKKKNKTERRILWKYGDVQINQGSTPFSVNRTIMYTCQYGKPRRKSSNENMNEENDHQYIKKKRFLIQTTKKVGCEAKLVVRYITRYPDYSLPEKSGRVKRQTQLNCLTDHLQNGVVNQQSIMHIKIPLSNAHTNHKITAESGYSNTIHPDLKALIKQHVQMGLTSVPYLRRVVKEHVKLQLCNTNIVNPADTDRAYYPTSRDIYNQVHQCLSAGQYSGLDQENLQHKIENWESGSSDRFYFRPCTGEKPSSNQVKRTDRVFPLEDSDDEEEEESVSSENENIRNTFLFVHQTKEQSQLMRKYGELTLIDSTYKTSKYALPLFLLVVRTNVTYVPVAQFIVESESIENITEALLMLQVWNKDWKPEYFMMDYSDIEYQAVHNVFPDARNYLCQFHVEQAWLRWTRKKKNNLTDCEAEQLISMMRNVSIARNEEDYEKSVKNLKESDVYRNHENVRIYLENFWLSIPERWCRAFLEIGFNSKVRTNNGVESLNGSLKNFYTKLTGTGSVTSLVEILVKDFVPDQISTYRRLNYQYSSQYRQYNQHIPVFLHNLPRNVVSHCLTRFAYAANFSGEHIDELSTGLLLVKSETEESLYYTVDLGSPENLLSCSCDDFLKSFLPCKHIFAVLRHTHYCWDDISCRYLESPYLQLDPDFISAEALDISTEADDLSNFLEVSSVSGQPISCTSNNSTTAIDVSRRKLRESIKILDDLTFLSQSADVMSEVNLTVENLISNLKLTVDKVDNIPVHRGQTAKLSTKTRTRQLPLRRKKSKMQKKQTATSYILSVKEASYHGVKDDSASIVQKGKKKATDNTSEKRGMLDKSSGKKRKPKSTGNNALQKDESQGKKRKTHVDEIITETQSPDLQSDVTCVRQFADKKSFVLEKVKEFLFSIDDLQYQCLLTEAQRSEQRQSADMTERIGAAVLRDVCSNEEETEALLISLKAIAPSNQLETVQYRLVYMILEKLVVQEVIEITPAKDPRLKQAKIDKFIQEHLKGLTETTNNISRKTSCGSKSTVSFTKEAIELKKKAQLNADCSECYPGGGLVNPRGKNLCFANALLQCMRIADLHRILQYHTACTDEDSCFTCSLKKFMTEGSITAEPVCRKMTSIWSSYKVGQQQDSHELLHIMMQEIEEKCFGSDNTLYNEEKRLFYGQEKSVLICNSCQAVSSTKAAFSSFSLPIEKHQNIAEAIGGYFKSEQVERKCDFCKTTATATKKITLEEIPKNIVIQLQRFGSTRRKVMKKIDIHLEIYLRKYVEENKVIEDKAKLYGVIVHKGNTLSNGHYYAFILFGSQWYLVDDMRVKQVTIQSLQNIDGQPYLLFYRTMPRPYIS